MSSEQAAVAVPVPQTIVEAPATPAAAGYRTFVSLVLAHLMIDCLGGIWPVYKTLAGLDLFLAGVIQTSVGMIGTATQPFFGLWADRRNRRWFIVVGCLLSMAAMLLGPLTMMIGQPVYASVDGGMTVVGRVGNAMPLGLAYVLMFAIMMCTRLGQDMFHPAGVGLAGSFAPAKRSMMVAIFVACGAIGFGFSQSVFAFAYQRFNMHTELMLIGWAAVFVLVFLWCRPSWQPQSRYPSLREVAADLKTAGWPLAIMFAILALSAAVNIGLHFLLPEFVKARGYPLWVGTGGAFLFLILGSAALMIPVGRLADRFGRRRMLIIMLVISAISYHALVRLPTMPLWAFIGLALLAGGFLGTINPLGIAFGQHMAPRNVSMVSALMMGAAWCIGSMAPAITGWLAKPQRLGPLDTLAWLGVVNVAMVGLGLLLPRGEKAASHP